MKYLLIVVWLLSTGKLFSQTDGTPAPNGPNSNSIIYQRTDTNEVKRVQLYTLDDLRKAEQEHKDGQTLTIVGGCLMGTSPIFFIPGLYTTIVGAGFESKGAVIAGATIMCFGVLEFVAGIPLLAVGVPRMHNADEDIERIQKNLQLRGMIKSNGEIGLALRF